MRLWRRNCAVLMCLALLAPASGNADEGGLCTGLKSAVALAQSDFEAASGSSSLVAAPKQLAGAAMCSMAKDMSGANSFHCAWEFAYRDAAAQTAFDRINGLLGSCLDTKLEAAKDSAVNHPDFFDLREYNVDRVKVTVSIKDKGQLGKTLVFIGVHGVRQK